MISSTETTETALATEAEQPKAAKKASAGKRSAHVAPAKAKSGKKASQPKKAASAKKAPKGRLPRRQQSCHDPGPAQAEGWGDLEGTDESDWLAGAFRARVPLRHSRQENGAGRHIHEGRGRRAGLFRQKLILAYCSLPPRAAVPPPGGVPRSASVGLGTVFRLEGGGRMGAVLADQSASASTNPWMSGLPASNSASTAAISRRHRAISVHTGTPGRSAATSSNVRPLPSSVAFLPLSDCHRCTATSTYFGSSSSP